MHYHGWGMRIKADPLTSIGGAIDLDVLYRCRISASLASQKTKFGNGLGVDFDRKSLDSLSRLFVRPLPEFCSLPGPFDPSLRPGHYL